MLKYKQLRYLIFSTAIMLVNGCGVYGAKQFDPNVAANDLSKPLTEQFTDYFYGVQLDDFLSRGSGPKNHYRYYPDNGDSYHGVEVFTTAKINLINLELWNKISQQRCNKYGGNLVSKKHTAYFNVMCLKNDLPLFYISINDTYNSEIYIGNSNGAQGISAVVAEATDYNNQLWLSKAKKEGWQPGYENKIKSDNLQYSNKQKLIKKQIDKAYADTSVSPIGTMICKNGDASGSQILSIGYIEDKSANKLKISLVKKIYVSLNMPDPSFSPITIWDHVKNWYVCDYDIN